VLVRVWATPPRPVRQPRMHVINKTPRHVHRFTHAVVFDTETTTGLEQALLYGGYRFCRIRQDMTLECLEEGLIYADDLPTTDPEGFQVLVEYVAANAPDVVDDLFAQPRLRLLSRSQFVQDVLWRACYKLRAVLVTFNAPFDLSRIALGAVASRPPRPRKLTPKQRAARVQRSARRRATWSGISLQLFEREQFRFRVVIKSLDSKRALKVFTRPGEIDAEDRLDLEPTDPPGDFDLDDDEGKPKPAFSGHLLDLRTLAFALTNTGHTLDSAGRTFAIAHPKTDAPEHGLISVEHVDYCRADVRATAELFEKSMAAFARHPVELQATKAYSPASLAKAYLRAMEVQPVLDRQPDFDPHVLGWAMSAFYGGRAEVRHRRQSLPCRLVDFTSMYPTIVARMGLWGLLTAERIEIVWDTDRLQALLDRVAITRDVPPEVWEQLVGLGQVLPDGDVLPIRAPYGEAESHTIGINHAHFDAPKWYALPDLAASAVITGRAPRLLRGLRLVGSGQQPGLAPVRLFGQIDVDPAVQDPFRAAVEERQRIKNARPARHLDGCLCGECALIAFLKVFANAGAYGIFAEMIRDELPAGTTETVHAYADLDEPWDVDVHAVERPGEFCFPPIAACITAGARLMLALLEHRVTELGGSWLFCDTDSMAIIATPTGGAVLPVGSTNLDEQVHALSDGQVQSIIDSFTALSPYDQDKVPGSILHHDSSGLCHAISAKRYAIWEEDPAAPCGVAVVKASQHGLGHLLNPTDRTTIHPQQATAPAWIRDAWTWILTRELGHPAPDLGWLDLPALSRTTVTSPHLLVHFARYNKGKAWRDQVKPFNFLLIAHVTRYHQPADIDGSFTLIAPYSNDPSKWLALEWVNRHDPDSPSYTITTDNTCESTGTVRVQTYRDVLTAHVRHPEAKFSETSGQPCAPDAVGPLYRQHITDAITGYIGKEADRIEAVNVGLVAAGDSVTTEYGPPFDTFQFVRAALSQTPTMDTIALIRQLHPESTTTDAAWARTIQRVLRGATPHDRTRQILEDAAVHMPSPI
jgi:hypothetical protein